MDLLMAAEAGGSGGGDGYWQLALVLAGIGFLGLFARWRKARRPPPVNTRELRERDREPNRYRDAADRAIVELLETSRELNAQVDTKIRLLNRLVKDAEEHANRLEKLLAAAHGVNAPAPAPAAPAPVPDSSPTLPEPPERRKREFRSELQERIFRLRDEGKSMAEIAKATGLSTTEVDFAIRAFQENS